MSDDPPPPVGNEAPRSLLSVAVGASAAISAAVTAAGFVSLEAGARRLGLASPFYYSLDAIANGGIAFWLSTTASLPFALFSGPGVAALIGSISTIGVRLAFRRWPPQVFALDRRWARVHDTAPVASWVASGLLLVLGYVCVAAVLVDYRRAGILFDPAPVTASVATVAYAQKVGWAVLGTASFGGFLLVLRTGTVRLGVLGSRFAELVCGAGAVTLFFALAAAYGLLEGTDLFHRVTRIKLKADQQSLHSGEQAHLYLLRADKDVVVLYDASTRQLIWMPREGVETIRLGARAEPR